MSPQDGWSSPSSAWQESWPPCWYINWPRKWHWRVNPKSMLKDYVEAAEPATLDSMRRDLALHLNDAHVANEKKLRRLWKALRIGMGSLVVEVVAFIVALAVR